MEGPTWYLDSERGLNPIKGEKEEEGPISQVMMSIPATSDTRTEDETEIQEEFCAVMERIKSEEMEFGDTKPAVSHKSCKSKRFEQSPEPIPQSSTDASLLLRCRLCAIQNDDMVDIFCSKEEDIPGMIKRCLPIVVKETDTLPKRSCWPCLDRLQLFYQFTQIVAKAESQLLALDRQALLKLDERDKNCQPSSGTVQCGTTVHPEIKDTRLCGETPNAEPLITVKKGLEIAETVKRCPDLSRCSVVLVATETQPRRLRNTDCKKDGRRSSSVDRHNDANLSMDDSNFEKKLSVIDSQSTSESGVSRVTGSGSQTNTKNLLKALCEKEIEDIKIKTKTSLINNISDPHRRVNDLPIVDPVFEAPVDIGKRRYSCSECTKTYSTKSGLVKHRRLHTDKRLHTCQYCDKRFIWKSQRDVHQRQVHSKERPFKCSLCEKSFKSSYSMMDHALIHREHEDSAAYRCSICDKVFKYKSAVERHMVTHTGEKQWQCEYCKKRFTRKSTLRFHLSCCKERIDISKQCHKCNLCQKSFKSKVGLSRHYRLHTGKDLHSCQYCEKKFIWKSQRDVHQRLVHSGKRPFKCSLCRKSFKSSDSMMDHALIHREHGDSAAKRCSVCDKAFKYKSQLDEHVVTHTGEKQWQCDHCKKRFSRKSYLRAHLSCCKERIDINEQCHKCNSCPKSFKSEYKLRKHYRLHTGEDLYSCEYCKKNFESRWKRDSHLLVHTDNRSYKCATCDKSFKSYSNLKRHSVNHTDNRPRSQCDYCKKFLTFKHRLPRHFEFCKKRYE